MRGSHKKRKPSTNLNHFEKTKQRIHSSKAHDASQLTDNQSNVICFKTSFDKVKSTSNVSLEEEALTSILNRANKLNW
jgi:hypothetical protein